MAVLIETTLGDLEIDLYADDCAKESLNFLKLCKCKYYNYSLFHRVLKNYVCQTGDPTGTGNGGSSVFGLIEGPEKRYFPKSESNRFKHARKGTLSFVNNGSDMHGSQFIITLAPGIDAFDGKHSVFGEVAEESYDTLDKINAAICDESNMPYKNIRILHTIILEDPFDDPPGLPVPAASPQPTKEQLQTGRLEEGEDVDEFEGMSAEEVEELLKKREANARAQILEMVGDLPHADVKPPENVLFVCKLNPVTTDEDLKLIFSRFGKIVSCEVIRDWKTGESLQYAFIEFAREEECEQAYFKMDNVLIDDRRIHVDFSQSVSKMKGYSLPKGWKLGEAKTSRAPASGAKYDLVFDHDEAEHDEKRMSTKSSKRPRSRSPRREDRHRPRSDRSPDRRDRDRYRERRRSPGRGRSRSRSPRRDARRSDPRMSRHGDERRDNTRAHRRYDGKSGNRHRSRSRSRSPSRRDRRR